MDTGVVDQPLLLEKGFVDLIDVMQEALRTPTLPQQPIFVPDAAYDWYIGEYGYPPPPPITRWSEMPEIPLSG